MTYPIRNAQDLVDAICSVAVTIPTAIEVELRDGTRWQVDGVKTDVDGEGIGTTFVLCVGPKEEK